LVSHITQLNSGFLSFHGSLRGVLGRLGHSGDIRSDLTGTLGRFVDASGHFRRRRRLFFNRTCDRVGNVVDLIDDGCNFADFIDRTTSAGLDIINFPADIVRCLCCLMVA
jgi:hypothetical protein